MRIAIGSDHAGYALKDHLIEYLKTHQIDYHDFGGYKPEKIDYPVAAERVAKAVASGEYDKGVLICGSGIGISIAANKVKGIRAAVCSEPYSAKMSRAHNDANILAMGERVVGSELAIMILDTWLSTEYEHGRHQARVEMIAAIEDRLI